MQSSSRSRTFLATTSLVEFWDKSQPMLFLGKWCKTWENKQHWESLDAETEAGFSADQDPNEVFVFISQIYADLLPEITQWLNKIHQTDHLLSYWEMLMGPFLCTHIRTIYDRYSRLQKAYSRYPELNTIGLSEDSFVTPLNTNEYYLLSLQNDAWNLQIITQIIALSFKQPMAYQDFTLNTENERQKAHLEKSSYKLTTCLRLKLLWLIARWGGKKSVALMQHDFSKKKLFRLMLTSRFRILPLAPRELALTCCQELLKTKPDLSLRADIAKLFAPNKFSKLVLELLVVNMPLCFIENYKKICDISDKQYPHFVKMVIGHGMGEEMSKHWVARHQQKGAKRVGMQHGGGYGSLKFSSDELFEHKFSDFYITWGMRNQGKSFSAPVTSICQLIDKNKNRTQKINSENEILWVTTEFMKYPAEIRHGLCADHYERLYYCWQEKILTLLQPTIFSKIVIRLRYSDFSDDWKYLREKFPDLKLHKPSNRSSFFEQIQTANLLLFDNLNTTYLYGLGLNIPSILFWSDELWMIRDEMKCYFDALKKVGIFHTTIESAANMINKVGDDPFTWWNSKEVQLARQEFCDFFIKDSKEWLKEWKTLLLNIQ